jgi:ribonuclease BN (tRNA processing enzyme)
MTKIVFVGSGDAFGSGGRRQTCIALSGGDQFMLVDCGTTSVLGLKSLGFDPNSVSAVVISHLHGDHFGGLPFLILDGQLMLTHMSEDMLRHLDQADLPSAHDGLAIDL